jgi:hypothetical protein
VRALRNRGPEPCDRLIDSHSLPVLLAGQRQCQEVQRRALTERGLARIQETFGVETSARALHETPTIVVHSSGRSMGGRYG